MNNEMSRARRTYGVGRGEVHTGFWWKTGIDRRIIKDGFLRSGMGALTGSIWLRIGTSGGLL
jgi:hypothetical protein